MSIPPELIWAKMEAEKSKGARHAPAGANVNDPSKPAMAVKQSSASIFSEDTTYSYDKDFSKKTTNEKSSLGKKIKQVLK